MNLLDTLIKGGPLMILIGLCSIIALAVAIDRWFKLRKDRIIPDGLTEELQHLLRSRRLTDAVEICDRYPLLGVDVLKSGLHRAGQNRDVIRENLVNTGRQVRYELIKGQGVLATIASISPLLGLMGTVTGMIRVFREISIQGVGDPAALSGGISEALITTAAGLAVGIPTLIVHNYFAKRAEKISLELEKAAADLLELLDTQGPLDTGGGEETHEIHR